MPRILFVESGRKAWVPEGRSVLDAALELNEPISHVCNGGGSCSTCRIVCVDNPGNLSPPGPNEDAYAMGPGVRLGCQARIHGDVAVKLVRIPRAVLS